MESDFDLVGKLSKGEEAIQRFRLRCISPDDGKYGKACDPLREYLSAEAEWRACVLIQKILLETRKEFRRAEDRHVREIASAFEKIDPLNIALLEEKVTRHDQLAVIEEIGRYVSPETKALLHPGTTSYDILDTARSYLFRETWRRVMRPKANEVILQLCDIAGQTIDVLQAARTHLQNTSPVPFGVTIAGYAARLAERVENLDSAFGHLRGKISGIVGTGAGIEMMVGKGRAMEFEKAVLERLGLEPDYTATQIVQKERLADVGNGIVTLAHVVGDFAGDIRLLYSSAIQEVTSRDSASRLGGSSIDAAKNNPIDYENIEGKVPEVEGGMRVLYAMIQTDLQRDLRSSVQARYQPQAMMAQVYEMTARMNKALRQLSLNRDKIAQNLVPVREFPSEAMVTILKGEGWVHSAYGDPHTFVKEISKGAKMMKKPLLEVALMNPEFQEVYQNLSEHKKRILQGELELYIGDSLERARRNLEYARSV